MKHYINHNQNQNPRNFGEVDYEDHQIDIAEENYNKVNKELEQNEIPMS